MKEQTRAVQTENAAPLPPQNGKQIFFQKSDSGHTPPRLIGLLIIAGLCGIPPVYSASPYAWLPLLTLGFALVISGIYLLILRFSLQCQGRTTSTICQRGDSLPLSITVRNQGLLPCPRLEAVLCLTDSLGNHIIEQPVAAVIPSLSCRSLRFSMPVDHVGCYQAQLRSMKAFSLFGLARVRLADSPSETVLCMPRQWSIPCPDLSPLPLEETQVRSASPDEGYDYTGVRDYVVGDPIKNIHWKLSAHSDHYLVRQLETPGSPGVSILMDFHFASDNRSELLSQFDALTEAAWSLCVSARSQGYETELRFCDQDGVLRCLPISESDDRSKLTALLPAALTDRTASPSALLESLLADRLGKKNLIFCTGDISKEIFYHLESSRAARREPFLYYAAPRSEMRGGLSYDPERMGVPCRVFTTAAQLIETKASSRLTPEELFQEVLP